MNIHAYDIATCIYETFRKFYEMHLHAHDIAIFETFRWYYVYCVSSLKHSKSLSLQCNVKMLSDGMHC